MGWHHHGMVRGASGACAYFLDGTRKSTVTFTGNVEMARDVYFGSMGTGSRNAKCIWMIWSNYGYWPCLTQTSVTILQQNLLQIDRR